MTDVPTKRTYLLSLLVVTKKNQDFSTDILIHRKSLNFLRSVANDNNISGFNSLHLYISKIFLKKFRDFLTWRIVKIVLTYNPLFYKHCFCCGKMCKIDWPLKSHFHFYHESFFKVKYRVCDKVCKTNEQLKIHI